MHLPPTNRGNTSKSLNEKLKSIGRVVICFARGHGGTLDIYIWGGGGGGGTTIGGTLELWRYFAYDFCFALFYFIAYNLLFL